MMKVKFYEQVEYRLLKFAVILAKCGERWILCKHKERDTYEIPGGHREPGETILETARRELQEETGATVFHIKPVCVYSVTGKNRVNETGEETFGMLFFAEVEAFERELHSEMENVVLLDEMPSPEHLTYPQIQPYLMEEYVRRQEMKREDM